MAIDTIDTLIGKVQRRVGTLPDYFLVRDWVVQALREIYDYSFWSWKIKQGEFRFTAVYNTGTVTTVENSAIVVFAGGTVLTPSMVGRQIRIGGNSYPIKTIRRYTSATSCELDSPWAGPALPAQSFEIYQAFQTAPDDFESFAVVVDPTRNFQIDWWNYTIEDFDRADPRRAYAGSISYAVALRDYESVAAGIVGPVTQTKGSGNIPISGGSYSGAADAIFSIEVQAGGASFKWKKDGGAWSADTAINLLGAAQTLQEGVTITFPVGGGYVANDIFVFAASPLSGGGMPRLEFWPHKKVDEVIPYLYNCRIPDADDPNATIPHYIRGDVVVKKCLAACARWANPDNRYYSPKLAAFHDSEALAGLVEMEVQDQNRRTTDVLYDTWNGLPVLDANYLASHDIGYELNVLN